MNKKIIVIVSFVVLIVLAVGVWNYTSNKKATKAPISNTNASSENNVKPTTNEPQENHDMSTHGNYVTLSAYNEDPSKYAGTKKVYFFHAPWCPICQGIEKEINSDMTRIPKGVTLIKTDFDSSTDLRKKYGVTTQYTFVQVDDNGNETSQWSATNLENAIAGIK